MASDEHRLRELDAERDALRAVVGPRRRDVSGELRATEERRQRQLDEVEHAERRVRAAEQRATRYARVRGMARPQQRQRAEIDLEHAHDRHAAAVVRLHRLSAQERQLLETQRTYGGWWAAHAGEVGRLEIVEGLIALQRPLVERDPPEVSRDIGGEHDAGMELGW